MLDAAYGNDIQAYYSHLTMIFEELSERGVTVVMSSGDGGMEGDINYEMQHLAGQNLATEDNFLTAVGAVNTKGQVLAITSPGPISFFGATKRFFAAGMRDLITYPTTESAAATIVSFLETLLTPVHQHDTGRPFGLSPQCGRVCGSVGVDFQRPRESFGPRGVPLQEVDDLLVIR